MALVRALDVVQFCLCFTNRALWRVLIGAAVEAGIIQSFESVIYLIKGNLFSAIFPFSQTITFSIQAGLLYGVLNIKNSPDSHNADLRTLPRPQIEGVKKENRQTGSEYENSSVNIFNLNNVSEDAFIPRAHRSATMKSKECNV